jgi:hypothetical protein
LMGVNTPKGVGECVGFCVGVPGSVSWLSVPGRGAAGAHCAGCLGDCCRSWQYG